MGAMLRISVLEDKDDQRARTAELARRWGMERGAAAAVSEFASREAFLSGGGLASDVALLDIALPGDVKGGLAAAMELRRASEQAVICFLTDMAQFALEGYECFPQAFLVKPVAYQACAGSWTSPRASSPGRTTGPFSSRPRAGLAA